MSYAGNVNSLPSTKKFSSYLDNARAAYGVGLPDWIEKLARAADKSSASFIARRIGYSQASISLVCRGKYGADISGIEGKVRGALMGEEIVCPIVGEITIDRCLDEQKKKFVGTSAVRTQLYHACRNGCANSRLKIEGDEDAA